MSGNIYFLAYADDGCLDDITPPSSPRGSPSVHTVVNRLVYMVLQFYTEKKSFILFTFYYGKLHYFPVTVSTVSSASCRTMLSRLARQQTVNTTPISAMLGDSSQRCVLNVWNGIGQQKPSATRTTRQNHFMKDRFFPCSSTK